MSSALVINLTRFGDLIQSQAVIDDLHQAAYSVSLLCQNNFASTLPLLRNIDQTWLLPGSHLLASLAKDWQKAVADLSEFANRIRSAGIPDVILNLTPSLPARLLTSLLVGPETRTLGFGMDSLGYGVNHGVWASFFSVAAGRRANSPFNLADMMRRMALPASGKLAGSFRLAEPDSEARKWARNFLDVNVSAKGFIAFQLGASEDKRRWPVAKFRELGDIIWQKTGFAPVLLGSAAEKKLSEEYGAACKHPFLDAVGKTDILALAALLAETRLLVTNDTGTMHLAAGLARPIVAIFLATAQPWDTGPLLAGACSLEPDLDCHPCAFGAACPNQNQCLERVSAHDVATYALAQLRGEKLASPEMGSTRAWFTAIDPEGFTVLEPGGRIKSGPGVWLAWQRVFWQTLLEDVEYLRETPPENLRAMYEGLPEPGQEKRLAPAMGQAADLLTAIAEISPVAKTGPQIANLLLRNSERLQALLDASGCSSLASFWREFRLNQGSNLEKFGKQTGIMAAHVRVLAESMA